MNEITGDNEKHMQCVFVTFPLVFVRIFEFFGKAKTEFVRFTKALKFLLL
jgi:hypothetical protein